MLERVLEWEGSTLVVPKSAAEKGIYPLRFAAHRVADFGSRVSDRLAV